MDIKKLAAPLLIVGGLLLVLGPKLPDYKDRWFKQASSVEGATLVLVNEKTAATVQQTMTVRSAPDFVAANKLAGYINADKDDVWAKPLVEDAAKLKITPPLVGYVDIKDRAILKIRKIAPWKDKLEDSLK